MTLFLKNVTLFPEIVILFPKIYYKLFDKKVLEILIGDPKMWPSFLKTDLVSWKHDPISQNMRPGFGKCDQVSLKRVLNFFFMKQVHIFEKLGNTFRKLSYFQETG